MTNSDLILNIAVNLGRLGRWSLEKRADRITQFLQDSRNYLEQIDPHLLNPQFRPTFEQFTQAFRYLQQNQPDSPDWAESAFTWANILTHRAKLA